MTRMLIALVFVPLIAVAPAVAAASVKVTIEVLNANGTVHQIGGPNNPLPGFRFSAPTSAGSNTTVDILVGGSPRFFPSGGPTAASGDTFKFQNAQFANLFRCIKTDQSADNLTIKGLWATVTSAGNSKKLRITCETDPGDYNQYPPGTYAAGAALRGELRRSTSTISPQNWMVACMAADAMKNPCLRAELLFNGQPMNHFGLPALFTVSVPCSTSIAADSFCGSGGSWNPNVTIGQMFFASDTGALTCSAPCQPVFKLRLTAGAFAFGVPPGSTVAQGEFVKLPTGIRARQLVPDRPEPSDKVKPPDGPKAYR